MKTSEAKAFFQGNVSALARAAGVDQSTVYSWGEYPPDARQIRLQRVTKGGLTAEPDCRKRLLGMAARPEQPTWDGKERRKVT